MMTRIISIIAVLLIPLAANAQQNPDLLRLARLHGVALFVLEDKELEDLILKEIYLNIKTNHQTDFNDLVEEIIPSQLKKECKLLDTAGLMFNAYPYLLINDSIFHQSNRQRLECTILGKDNGSARKKDYKEINVIPYGNNPSLQGGLDSMHVLRSFMRIWSGINYQYPYKSKLPKSWESTFYEYLPQFTTDSSSEFQVYRKALKKLVKQINDGHVRLDRHESKSEIKAHQKSHRKATKLAKKAAKSAPENTSNDHNKELKRNLHLPPIALIGDESGLYVDKVFDCTQTKGIKKGDKVESVNGLSMNDILDRWGPDTSFQRKELSMKDFDKTMFWSRLGGEDSVIFKFEGKEETRMLVRVWMNSKEFDEYFYPEKEINLPENEEAVYLSLAERDKKVFKSSVKKAIKEEIPLIIDARDYPSKLFMVLWPRYLSNKAKPVSEMYLPLKNYPGIYAKRTNLSYFFTSQADLVLKMLRILPMNTRLLYPFAKQIKSPIVVLIDETTKSWGETTTMILDEYGEDQVTIIGRRTAGSNGDIGVIEVAGKMDLSYTHLKINDYRGKNYQHIGYPPDIYVDQKIDPANPHQDIILQTALNFLRKKEKQAVLE